MSNYTHFTLTIDADAIAHVKMDIQDSSVNLMRRAVMTELGKLMQDVAATPHITGMIFSSSKKMGFVYGADIREFDVLQTEDDVKTLVQLAHNALAAIDALPFPSCCLIDGIALGGGLEIALPFDHIIALDSPKTQIGFPEIQLGLMPGFAGTGRVVERVGVAKALDMCLSGKALSADQALEAGLVDGLAKDKDALLEAGFAALKQPMSRRKPDTAQEIKSAIAHAEAKYLAGHIKDQLPAPFLIIDHFKTAAGEPKQLILNEQIVFPKLMMSEASYHLRRVYRMRDAVRKTARGDAAISKVHVIGAGTMGGDIAMHCAMHGFQTSLTDTDHKAIQEACARANALFERRLKQPDAIKAATERLIADPDNHHISAADIVIEAASERLELKRSIFMDIEEKAKPDAILATNTSSILIEDIASCLSTPSRLIGLHFFNPATVMPLIEVIAGEQSDPTILNQAMYFAGALKKMPIKVKSSKGFLVNRALLPYIFTAIDQMSAGLDADKIDEAMLHFGMPMGPIELADQIGLDVCYDVGQVIGISKQAEAALSAQLALGRLGRKTGQGFYLWDEKTAIRPRNCYEATGLDALAKALLEPLVAQCQAAVDEGIIASQDDADIGCILGIGFPPHRGGPLGWANYQD